MKCTQDPLFLRETCSRETVSAAAKPQLTNVASHQKQTDDANAQKSAGGIWRSSELSLIHPDQAGVKDSGDVAQTTLRRHTAGNAACRCFETQRTNVKTANV